MSKMGKRVPSLLYPNKGLRFIKWHLTWKNAMARVNEKANRKNVSFEILFLMVYCHYQKPMSMLMLKLGRFYP